MKRHLDETEVRPQTMGHGKAKRGIPSKSENFNEWYPFIVEAAELVDKRYPIKGMDVWRPYGWKTMKLIDALTHAEMERTNHEEVNFPLLIPENLLEKENALVARLKRAREEGVDPDDLRDEEEEGGFKKEVYWVKHAGENDLDIPMFLRPTSETAMYTMFPLWIRSHKDLPLKIYQMVNTFRYETKQTRSFIRVREIHFFEAHTAHADEDDASGKLPRIWRSSTASCTICACPSSRPSDPSGTPSRVPGTPSVSTPSCLTVEPSKWLHATTIETSGPKPST